MGPPNTASARDGRPSSAARYTVSTTGMQSAPTPAAPKADTGYGPRTFEEYKEKAFNDWMQAGPFAQWKQEGDRYTKDGQSMGLRDIKAMWENSPIAKADLELHRAAFDAQKKPEPDFADVYLRNQGTGQLSRVRRGSQRSSLLGQFEKPLLGGW